MSVRTGRLGLGIRALVLAAVLAACGGGGTKTVAASTWAGNVCGQILAWGQQIQAAFTSLSSSLQGAAGSGDVTKARDELVNFLDDLVNRTDQLIGRVEGAGTPDTPKGKEAASSFRAGLEDIRRAFADGKAKAQDLSTNNNEEFQKGADELNKKAQTALEQAGSKFKQIQQEAPGLNQAFKDAPACQTLNQASG
jgi:hypothetical protein